MCHVRISRQLKNVDEAVWWNNDLLQAVNDPTCRWKQEDTNHLRFREQSPPMPIVLAVICESHAEFGPGLILPGP